MKGQELSVPSPRESEVLLRLAMFRYLSRAQVAEFVFGGQALAPASLEVVNRRVIGVLTTRGLLASTPRMVGGPGGGASRLVYYLTPSGYRLARLLNASIPAHRAKSPGTFLIRHALMTAEVALAFGRAARQHEGHELVAWESDWQAALPLGASAVIPDGYFVYAVEARRLHAFLEVDLGTEHTAFFLRKIRRYLDLYRSGSWRSRLPVWPTVLVVAEGEARSTLLRRATETLLRSRADERLLREATPFAFAAVASVLGPSGPHGEIWDFAGRAGLQRLVPADTPTDGQEMSAALQADE